MFAASATPPDRDPPPRPKRPPTRSRQRAASDPRRVVAGLFCLALLPAGTCLAQSPDRRTDLDEQRNYTTLGVTPYLTPATLPDAYAGFRKRLAQILKQSVRVHTASSLETFRDRLERQQDDLVLVEPTDYDFAIAQGYLPLLRQEAPYKAFLATGPESPVATLKDLRNRVVGVPPRPSPIARLTADALRHAGLRPGDEVVLRPMRTAEACIREMLRGLVSACASAKPALRVVQERQQIKLRILGETDALPGLLLMVREDLPEKTRADLRDRLLRLSGSRSGKDQLRRAGLGPWVQVDARAYQSAVAAFLASTAP